MLETLPKGSNALIRILDTNNDRERMKLPLYVCVTCPQTEVAAVSCPLINCLIDDLEDLSL